MELQFDVTYALDFDCTLAEINSQLAHLGFDSVQSFDRSDGQLREVVFASRDQSQIVRYIDDHFVEVHLLRVQSADRERHHELIADLKEHLNLYSRLDLDELAQQEDIVTRSFGLRGLAATCKGLWGAAMDDYRAALDDSRPDVRRIALLGIARLAWLEFVPDLERVIQREQDPQIREETVALLAGLRKHGKHGVSTPW